MSSFTQAVEVNEAKNDMTKARKKYADRVTYNQKKSEKLNEILVFEYKVWLTSPVVKIYQNIDEV